MEYWTLQIPIPVQNPLLWLALFGAAILALSWLITHWPSKERRSQLLTLHERPMTNVFVWFATFLSPFWLALMALTLWGTFALWFTEPPPGDSHALAYRVHYLALVGLMTALAGLIGAPLAIHRLYTVERQTKAQEEGLITDRINKAVEGLGAEKSAKRVVETPKFLMEGGNWVFDEANGNPIPIIGADGKPVFDRDQIEETVPNLEVRIGAIYALERIAQDSLRDHIQIMEILCAYVRENAPVKNLEPSSEPFIRARPRSDVQAVIDVIGRRSNESIILEHSKAYRLDLRKVDLSGANFLRGNYEGVLLFDSRLEASTFRCANLRAARLQNCLLNFADFYGSNLRGALLDGAKINRLDAWNGSITTASNTLGLSVAGSDLSAINHLPTGESHSPTFGTKDTALSFGMEEKRDKLNKDIEQFNYAVHNIEIDDKDGVSRRLREAGFLYWSPFDATDGVTNSLRLNLWKNISLLGFPYEDKFYSIV